MKDSSAKAGKAIKHSSGVTKKSSGAMKDNVSKDRSGSMKDKVFKIKIADLLNETGRQDEVVFEHKFSDQLPNLDDEGVSGTFTVQSLDKTSLLGTLADVTARFHETCDSCGTSFIRPVEIPSYTARFVFEDDVKKKETPESEEVILFIDPKAETINIEDMVVQSILLSDPFVKRCKDCTKRLESSEYDEDDLGEFQATGNITFS